MNLRMRIHSGDITELNVDAIVNAANRSLLGGGGVDGAIHNAAGPQLLAECRGLGGCEPGDAKITKGYSLNARYIIHTVGPIYKQDPISAPRLLASCYRRSLEVAAMRELRTVAFPAISCGAYGYPPEEAVPIAVRAVYEFLNDHKDIEEVIFACVGDHMRTLYEEELRRLEHEIIEEHRRQAPAASDAPELRKRVIGGILGVAVGDALGVPVEASARIERDRDPVSAMRGFGTWNQPPGTWSDDTSLTLCTIRALIQGYDPREMMNQFKRWLFRADPTPHGSVFDVGVTTREAILNHNLNRPPSDWGLNGEFHNGNGSLMRILPVSLYTAFLRDERTIILSFEASGLTHGHMRSKLCCAFFSLVVKYVIQGNSLIVAMENAAKIIKESYVTSSEQEPLANILSGDCVHWSRSKVRSSGYVVHTLEAALWACANHESFREKVLAAVNLGGDADTIGAVTGGLAGVMHGSDAVPKIWVDTLARKELVVQLAKGLADAVERQAEKEE